MKLEGKVWRYGDNIDTDVIIPARYLNSFDPKELAEHCMVDIDESFAKNVKAGDIMVGGKNFGFSPDSIIEIIRQQKSDQALDLEKVKSCYGQIIEIIKNLTNKADAI